MSLVQRTDRVGARPGTQLADRQPPLNLDAEEAVLCSILLRPEICDNLIPLLRSEDFYDDAHRRLYQLMVRMHDTGKRIDMTLLVDELKRQGEFDRVGGAACLGKISSAVGTAAHAEHYARIVLHHSTCRSLINACTDILSDAYDTQEIPCVNLHVNPINGPGQTGRGEKIGLQVLDLN